MKKYYPFLIFIIIFFLCPLLFCAEVAEVEFQQNGSFKFADDVLRCNVQTKKGLVFSDRIVNEDVRRLYSLGMFSDVVSLVEDASGGKKKVIFRVVPKPVVSAVVFEGNKKYDNKKLTEFVTIATGAPLNDLQLAESAEKLRSFYLDEGLTEATVSPAVNAVENGVQVEFHIKENLRLRVNSVKFDGNTVYNASELADGLETRYSFLSVDWLAWLPIQGQLGLYNRDAIDRDKIRIRDIYWKKGYLDLKVTGVEVTEEPGKPELLNIVFKVEEGEPYFLGNIRINGAKRFSEDELSELLTFQQDSLYTSTQNDAFMKSVEDKYRPLGYADFMINCQRHPNYETHTVDLDYTIREGIPYSIGEVYIAGNRMTKDHVIRREILLYPDDPLDQTMIDYTKSRLMGMGYFAGTSKDDPGVEILAVNSPDDPAKKDIHINVKEKRFIDAKIGAGWSSDDSLSGMIELSHSNMDILDPAHYFTGGGQRMRIMALAGIEHMGLEANFTEPWLFGIPLRLDISGYWREVVYDEWNERRIGFSVALTKRIFDDFTTVSGGYMFEAVRVYDMAQRMSSKFQDQKGTDLVGRIFLSLERDTRNSATNPTNGYLVGVNASLTSKGLGASHDYYKVEIKGINYFSFLHDWFVLSTGFKVGSTGTFTKDEDVPLYDRYFLGGGDSIRGFPYRSIGPLDCNDDNYGGQFMYLLTAELSHPIWENYVRGAVFVDVGDTTSGMIGPINSPNIGLGYGLRIKLPSVEVPIRLDLAYPVLCNQENVSKKLRFHFNMGFSF